MSLCKKNNKKIKILLILLKRKLRKDYLKIKIIM
jgi:hypothetical protein